MKIYIVDGNFTEPIIKKIYNELYSKYNYDQFVKGMKVELEHGSRLGKDTNVTNDDPYKTAKIVIAHLKEDERYYDKLETLGL